MTPTLRARARVLASPMAARKDRKGTPEAEAITMFWGLPMGVQAEPMLAEVATAMRKGLGENPRALQAFSTRGGRSRQAESLVISALRIAVKMDRRTKSKSCPPFPCNSIADRASYSPCFSACAESSMQPVRSVSVGRDIAPKASEGVSKPKATYSVAQSTALTALPKGRKRQDVFKSNTQRVKKRAAPSTVEKIDMP